jgi:sterol desaturase/sphingolipid hydroxylase (fatty acid hydroxylase superfamily)
VSRSALLGLALVGWFVLLALAELRWRPKGAEILVSSNSRLVTNFGFAILILSAGALFPLAGIASSVFAQRLDVGLARHAALPWIAIFALLLLADSFVAYWAHRLMHGTSLFWRVHRVHHADQQVDVSTSLRNHPLELLVTMPASTLVILAVGAPVSAVAVLQTLLVGSAIWQHADIALPQRLDRALSILIVTQRVHRMHHSPERAMHDSNYGELLIIWDRLFGTFTSGRERERVGLDDQVARPDRLFQQIWSPVHAA